MVHSPQMASGHGLCQWPESGAAYVHTFIYKRCRTSDATSRRKAAARSVALSSKWKKVKVKRHETFLYSLLSHATATASLLPTLYYFYSALRVLARQARTMAMTMMTALLQHSMPAQSQHLEARPDRL
jgi:hypothetical protein